jgi:type IV secretion system protein VirB2
MKVAVNKQVLIGFGLLLVSLALGASSAYAGTTSGGGLPYESWLTSLQHSVTGPVASVISIIGIVLAGGTLIWGGEISGFFKTLLYIVLVMAFLVGAENMMTTFFGQGAVVGQIFSSIIMKA